MGDKLAIEAGAQQVHGTVQSEFAQCRDGGDAVRCCGVAHRQLDGKLSDDQRGCPLVDTR